MYPVQLWLFRGEDHLSTFADESDDEDERPSRRRRIAERAAEGAEDEEVQFQE